jgi:Ni2+-binding GTPase involved in maturation of urease and hydrogenase
VQATIRLPIIFLESAVGLINWIFDIYQHTKIDEARREAAEARAEAAAVRTSGGHVDAAQLVRALEELALATKTVQRTLVEKGICTKAEFEERMRQIYLEDGRADGRTPLR